MCEVHIVMCPCCEGEGVVPIDSDYYDGRDGTWHTPTDTCGECDGEGWVFGAVQRCTLEDLETNLWVPA